ncbi:hypothetical protein NL676_008049 [Syzygium grande]|nr:hypothetical protein NL676_008049 [Syzygium grande]
MAGKGCSLNAMLSRRRWQKNVVSRQESLNKKKQYNPEACLRGVLVEVGGGGETTDRADHRQGIGSRRRCAAGGEEQARRRQRV